MALPPSGLTEALRAWHKVNSEGASSDKADAASRAGELERGGCLLLGSTL